MDHANRDRRRESDAAPSSTARRSATGDHPLLHLQRSVGNRALAESGRLSDIVNGVAREADEADAPSLQRSVAPVGTAVVPVPDPPPGIQRKLEGTAAALEAQGGGQTSGKLRKLVGARTLWDQVVRGVQAYEALEKRVLTNGPIAPDQVQHIKGPLIEQLQRIERDCLKWQRKNPDGGEREAWHEKSKAAFGGDLQESDTRAKAPRRQAIAMLLPRVRLEIQDLNSGKWAAGMGLNPAKLTGEGVENRGQVNPVKELFYQTDQGEFSGYFKEDKGFAKEPQGHEIEQGIHQADPNYGARAIAMYRLDQLFGAGVTAKTEYAIHNGKMGTVMESVGGEQGNVKGTQASEAQWAMSEDHQGQKQGSVAANDPMLQKCLNKLQILDAICGQMDRHQGNWFVQTDMQTGKVTGVKGIDLDMAFGGDMPTTDQAGTGENYLGMTQEVDRDFGMALIQITEQDIENVLRGLLSDAEIAATVSRFRSVKEKVQTMAENGTLTGTWDDTTFNRDRTREPTRKSGHKNYTSQMAGNSITDVVLPQIRTAFEEYFGKKKSGPPPPGFNEAHMERLEALPEVTRGAILEALDYDIGFYYPKYKVWSGEWPGHLALQIAVALANGVFTDQNLMARMEVKMQEIAPGEIGMAEMQKIMEPWIDQKWPQIVANLTQQPVEY